MITTVRGRSSLMRLVASSPSMSGMRTSMRTTSGRSRRVASIASRPVRASPAISLPSALWRIPAPPWRPSSGSSTSNTRVATAGLYVPRSNELIALVPRSRSVQRQPHQINDEQEHREHEQHDDDGGERAERALRRVTTRDAVDHLRELL